MAEKNSEVGMRKSEKEADAKVEDETKLLWMLE